STRRSRMKSAVGLAIPVETLVAADRPPQTRAPAQRGGAAWAAPPHPDARAGLELKHDLRASDAAGAEEQRRADDREPQSPGGTDARVGPVETACGGTGARRLAGLVGDGHGLPPLALRLQRLRRV